MLSFFSLVFLEYQTINQYAGTLLESFLFTSNEEFNALLAKDYALIPAESMIDSLRNTLWMSFGAGVLGVIALNVLGLLYKKLACLSGLRKYVKEDICGLFPNIGKKMGFVLALIPFILFIGSYVAYSNYKTDIDPKQKIFPLVSKIGSSFLNNSLNADKRVDRVAYKNSEEMKKAIQSLEESGKDSIEVALYITKREQGKPESMSLMELKVKNFFTSVGGSKVYSDMTSSLTRLFQAMFIASIVALVIAMFMGMFKSVELLLSPFLTFFGAIQPVAILPILMIVAGVEDFGKIVFIITVLTTTLILATFREVKDVRQQTIIKGLTMGANTFKVGYKVILPLIAPKFINIIRANLYLGWIFLLTAEMISAESGLGYRIMLFKRSTAMDNIIGYVILITVLSLTIDYLLRQVNNKAFAWYNVSK
jgi:NitT/TauT family transport system permease protein